MLKHRLNKTIEKVAVFLLKDSYSTEFNAQLQEKVLIITLIAGTVSSFIPSVFFALGLTPYYEAVTALALFLASILLLKITRNIKLIISVLAYVGTLILILAIHKSGGVFSILFIWFICILIFINFLLPKLIGHWTAFFIFISVVVYFTSSSNVILDQSAFFALTEIILALVMSLCGILMYNWVIKAKENEINVQKEELAKFTEEIRRFNNELIRKSEQLQTINEQLEKFAYVVSHDLKTPLRSIIGFTQLAAAESSQFNNKTLNKHLAFVTKSGFQLNELIDDILTISKEESQLNEPFTAVNMPLLLGNLHTSLSASLIKKNAKFTFNPDLPHIQNSKIRIFRLFQNLAENGIKFNESSVPHVHIDFSEKEKHIEFYFRDNGIGISPDFHESIFLYNQRADSEDYEGSGIGLSICKSIVESMNGTIQLESIKGKGSTFTVAIPKS
jgi:signal transduction histidine kinase